MNRKNIFVVILVVTSLFLISCDKKQSPEEKEFAKVQKIYDKKGMDGFCKYVAKNLYVAVKDYSQNGATPLLIALKNGDLENAKLFMEKGASEVEKDSTGNDMLDYVLQSSDLESLYFVIEKFPSPFWNIVDSNGCLPLVKVIVQCSDFSAIRKCIDLTRDINHADENGKTPLMYCSSV